MTNHNFIKISGSTLLLISIFTFRVSAQESLSLQQAIKIGLENNFSIQIEKQKQVQAANNNTLGQAGALPNISLAATPNHRYSDSDTDSPFGFPGANKTNSVSPILSANWALFNGFNVRMTKDKLGLLEAQSDGNTALIVENTIQAIILAYYNVLLENERTEVFRSSLKLSRDRYNYSKLKKELGSAVTFDILKDKNSYLTDSSNYISQVYNLKNARRNLNLLLARDVNDNYLFTDILRVVKKEYAFDDLASKMTSNNNNLKNQFINQHILKKEVFIAKSGLYPSVNLNLSGSHDWSTTKLGNPIVRSDDDGNIIATINQINNTSLNITAGITLSFTLFNGNRTQTQIKNARIQERIGNIQIDQLKSTLQNDLIGNFDQYNLRKSLMGISDENLNTADLNLQLAEDRYKNGSITSFDYRTIQITYLQTALTFYQSIYNLIDTEIELLRLSGGLMEVYK
jgi:outer membrane protein TolC